MRDMGDMRDMRDMGDMGDMGYMGGMGYMGYMGGTRDNGAAWGGLAAFRPGRRRGRRLRRCPWGCPRGWR